MRKAALLYNARSGGRRSRRDSDLHAAVTILASAGVDASLTLTQSGVDATEQARKAIVDGCDTVFACGGDGTVHDIVQAMAGTRVALGVIPMGTANALAHDLGLPLDPARAARAALDAEPRRVALGRLQLRALDGKSATRFFTVAVGVGVDAHLFYKLHSGIKERMGMAAYYTKAWQLWFSHRMEHFAVQHDHGQTAPGRRVTATEMLAVRIRNFGGVLHELAPGASLDRDDLRLVLCSTDSRLSYLLYVTRSLLGVNWKIPGVELFYSKQVRCDYATDEAPPRDANRRVYVEADGELAGTLPAEITMLPDALTLLSPRRR
jgi:YegS/Rv2252/BmrU family lipid kinase